MGFETVTRLMWLVVFETKAKLLSTKILCYLFTPYLF